VGAARLLPRASGLQGRRDLGGQRVSGFECTVAVDDADAAAAAAREAGGAVLMDRATIPGVGDLVFVRDPGGNVVGAMRYDDPAG
jgi:predicted enzyme related to lactoylglutathione lyase